MRLAELVGTLSLATDAGTGMPEEHGLRSAALAVRLGEVVGSDEQSRSDAFYLTLLRYSGCSAGADIAARVMGDEVQFIHDSPGMDFGRLSEILPAVFGRALSGGGLAGLSSLADLLTHLPRMAEVGRQHCETAVVLGRRFGFGEDFLAALHQGFERWDGTGQPTRAKAEAIALPMRLAQLALDADRGFMISGEEGALALTKKHTGRELEPKLVEAFSSNLPEFRPIFEASSGFSSAMAGEPGPVKTLDEAGTDEALSALADFADLQSRFTRGHSRAVAELASEAAKQLGLDAATQKTIHRAGLVHDVGRVAVSVRVWDKPGKLTDPEWERVRLHSYVGERILSRAPGLLPIAQLATLVHERLDGHGYHRQLDQAGCSLGARLLAAADMYQALTVERAHRPALSRSDAAKELRQAAAAGALAPDAVEVILGVAGHRAKPPEGGGLTARELEVLALLARGLTNKEIGNKLDISAKTAGRHLEHIFEKLSVTTRAGAVVVALSRGLIRQ